MKKRIRLFSLLLVLCIFVSCSPKEVEKEGTEETVEKTVQEEGTTKRTLEEVPEALKTIRIAGLKGPTSFGVAPLTQKGMPYKLLTMPEEAVAAISKKEVDFAFVPANLAAVLYQKTQGSIQVAAVNNLGVLYMVDNYGLITNWEDLEGKTIYTTGKGATPDIVLHDILEAKGIHAQVEFKSEATEIVGILSKEEEAIALLPEPFISVAKMKNDKLHVALDLNETWEEINGFPLVTGVLVVGKDYAKENQETVNLFLKTFEASLNQVKENPKEGAEAIDALGVVPKAVAEVAIPKCALHYMEGEEMKGILNQYFTLLYEKNKEFIGGKLPLDDFYYGQE